MVRHKPTNCGVVAKCETEIWRVGNESAEDPASHESLGPRAAMKVASLAPAISSPALLQDPKDEERGETRYERKLVVDFCPAGV